MEYTADRAEWEKQIYVANPNRIKALLGLEEYNGTNQIWNPLLGTFIGFPWVLLSTICGLRELPGLLRRYIRLKS